MKKWLVKGTALGLLMLMVCSAALAQISGIHIMSVRYSPEQPVIYMEMRALDGSGNATKTQRSNVKIVAGEKQVELAAEPLPDTFLGHIIVIDTSHYYLGTKYIKAENLSDIVSAYLSRLSAEEQVCFMLAGDADKPEVTDYMTVADALSYVRKIELSEGSSSCLSTAVTEAFEMATSPKSMPMFNSVFIVADPDMESNKNGAHSLAEAALIRNDSNMLFDVTVVIPYRRQFLEGTNQSRRAKLEEGMRTLESFASQVGGRYIEVPQDNNGVDTGDLHITLSGWTDTTMQYAVDCSAIAGHLPTDDELQTVPLSVFISDGNGQAVRTVDIVLNTTLLPEPQFTPEPELTPEVPTPTPAPTPVIIPGQEDTRALQAIHALYTLHYLDSPNHNDFDSTCYSAFLDFCKSNGISVKEGGVFEDAYKLLLSERAVAKDLPTPEPTATPQPTVPPQGYAINDSDSEGSGGYIARMQFILKRLNCYADGASSNSGRMDQATVDAINRYCEAYNWYNTHPNGVDKVICTEILTNGMELTPLEPVEPSLSEKAREFLARRIKLGSFELAMWIPVVLCVVFLFLIVIMVVLLGGRKDKPASSGSKGGQPAPVPTPAPAPAPAPIPSVPASDDDDHTVAPFFAKPVTLVVSYDGVSREVNAELKETPPFTIGRKDCQLQLDARDKSAGRRHAELYFKNNQVYVRDVSTYHNTTINGLKARSGDSGTVVNNGDELQLSEHFITIRW